MSTFLTLTNHKLKNIIINCSNNPDKYTDPHIYLNKNVTCKYAYVTIVSNDLYISSAIVFAHSIRLSGSIVDIIVFVTSKISLEGKLILGTFFTKVKEVNNIIINKIDFTKYYAFNLIEYEKILLTNPDSIILKYPDHLFTLNPPAACCFEKNNKVNICNNKHDAHDKKILEEQQNNIQTDLLLLKPNKRELHNLIENFKKSKFISEQQFIIHNYNNKWTNINPIFFGFRGYPHWKILYGIRFGNDKPFILNSTNDIKDRLQYTTHILWHQYYNDILLNYQNFSTSDLLKEANEMNKYYQSIIKKQKYELTKLDKKLPYELTNNAYKIKIISKLIPNKQENFKINNNKLKYYHLEKDTNYQNLNLKPMWDDIKKYDYLEPINRLSKYFKKGNYYEDLYKICEEIYQYKPEPLENQFQIGTIDLIDKDTIILEYIKCMKNTRILMLLSMDNNIINKISKYGDIIYIKTLSLSKTALFNLMFWIYNEFTYEYKIEFITNKLKYINSTDNNQISFIFVDINDKGNYTYNNDDIYITKNFYQTIISSQLILNNNSLKLLEKQNIKNLSNLFFTDSKLKLQTLNKWYSLNLSLLEQERLILIGEIIFYLYGFKRFSNIRGTFVSIGNNDSQSEKDLADLLYNLKEFGFVNIKLEGSKYWSEEIKQNMSFFGISNMTELITDPKNYCYFGNFKFLLLETELLRKINRNKINDHADFIMLSTLYPEIISKYINFENNKLQYLLKKEQSIELSNEYIKKIMKLITKKYLKYDHYKIINMQLF